MRRRGLDKGRTASASWRVRQSRFPDVHDALPMMTLVFGRLVQSAIVLQSFPDRLNYEILESKVLSEFSYAYLKINIFLNCILLITSFRARYQLIYVWEDKIPAARVEVRRELRREEGELGR